MIKICIKLQQIQSEQFKVYRSKKVNPYFSFLQSKIFIQFDRKDKQIMKMTESRKHSQSMRENNYDYQSPKRNTELRKQLDGRSRFTQNRSPTRQRQLAHEFSPQTQDYQRQYENHDNQKTANDGLRKDTTLYNEQEMKIHKKVIEDMWDYRYWRLVDRAIKSKDWMPVFAFLGQFKLKCLQVAKMLFNEKFNRKQIDKIDHRYDMKGDSQIGIYFIDGIIFRVARIKKNKKQFDKRAEKNLHQQFISTNIINNLIISLASEAPDLPTLRVPVTCLLKYMGYTFLCQGDTMCNGIQTLIYGPMSSTFKYQEKVSQILNIIGRNLNLKSFKVITASKNIIQIPFCLTIQLHQVNIAFRDINIISWFNPESPIYPVHQNQNKLKKPEFYFLSFSKLWPLFIDSNIVKSYGYLRPQAVLSWKKELSNAVFTNIAFEKDEQGQLQLAEACKNVKQQNIKELTKFLDQATFFVVDSVGIEEIMHYYKINMRFIGLVANKFTLVSNRRIFQVEMVARVLKKIFYTNLDGFEDKYNIKELLADFLNLVFVQSSQGQKFYMDVIYPHIQKYYDYEMNQYPPPFTGGGLLHALSFHFGIKLKIIDYPFFKKIEQIFNATYIIDISALVKSFDLETCSLKKACEKVKAKKKQGKYQQCINEYKILSAIARLSWPEGTYSIGSSPQAYFYSQLAQSYKMLGNNEQQIIKYVELALKKIPEKHADAIKPYCTLVQYYSIKKQQNRMLQYNQKSIANLNYHLQQNHPLSITVYNTLGFQILSSNDASKCEKIFQKSLQTCQQALGYMHATSGKILLQLAQLPLPPEKTIHYLLQALTILQNIQSDKDKVKMVCVKISQMYAKMGNLTKMIHYARKSDHWRNQIIALEKLNQYKTVLQLCSRQAANYDQLKFLIQKSFSSYVRLLDYSSSSNLYKIFVSLVDHLPDHQKACERIFNKIKNQFSVAVTIVQFVKVTLNSLLIEVPDLLKQHDFFVGSDFMLEFRDKRLKGHAVNYMDILAIVRPEKSQSIFTQFRKSF